MRPTKDINGTAYDLDAAPAVVDALERARRQGDRVRLFYGDIKTGKAWAEESDVLGTIGRSTGRLKVPLLLPSSRSTGGGAILTGSIVAILNKNGWLYRHPTFNPGAFAVLPSDLPDYAERVDVDGVNHARFKKPGQAARWVAFMTGNRMAP